MTRLNFRLATLLRLRRQVRDQRRVELAELLETDALHAAQIEALRRDFAGAAAHRRQRSQPGPLDVEGLRNMQRYQGELAAAARALAEERSALAGQIENLRQSLVEADTEVRSLEKLRQTQQSRHDDAQRRDEGRELDDVAIRLAAARRR